MLKEAELQLHSGSYVLMLHHSQGLKPIGGVYELLGRVSSAFPLLSLCFCIVIVALKSTVVPR